MTPAHGIMFHHFHGGRHAAGQGSIDAGQLGDMLDFVGRERILPAHEWLERAERRGLRHGDVCLTFDDNLRCQFDIARPALEERGLTAFWFVSTTTLRGGVNITEVHRALRTRCFAGTDDFYTAFFHAAARSGAARHVREALERFDPRTFLCEFAFYTEADRRFRFLRDEVLGPGRYEAIMNELIRACGTSARELAAGLWMDADCLKALQAEGHIIGLHTHTHPTRVGYLSREEQRREYRDNYMALLELLREPPTVAAHPCNSYNADTLAILRDLGVRIAFRANMALREHAALEYPREDHANLLRQMMDTTPAAGRWRP